MCNNVYFVTELGNIFAQDLSGLNISPEFITNNREYISLVDNKNYKVFVNYNNIQSISIRPFAKYEDYFLNDFMLDVLFKDGSSIPCADGTLQEIRKILEEFLTNLKRTITLEVFTEILLKSVSLLGYIV